MKQFDRDLVWIYYHWLLTPESRLFAYTHEQTAHIVVTSATNWQGAEQLFDIQHVLEVFCSPKHPHWRFCRTNCGAVISMTRMMSTFPVSLFCYTTRYTKRLHLCFLLNSVVNDNVCLDLGEALTHPVGVWSSVVVKALRC